MIAWGFGVILLSLRPLHGFYFVRQIRRETTPTSAAVNAILERLKTRLQISKIIEIAESSRVGVPVVVGYLRPMILLPASVISGLTPSQLEGIIAHELAHVRRHDYLVNVVQTMIETVLFYHPCVWWVSREVRRDREVCCDDTALGFTDRAVYARALIAIDELRGAAIPTAMAADGGSLLRRIRRIVGQTPEVGLSANNWLNALAPGLLCVAMMAALFIVPARADDAPPAAKEKQLEKTATSQKDAKPTTQHLRRTPQQAAQSRMMLRRVHDGSQKDMPLEKALAEFNETTPGTDPLTMDEVIAAIRVIRVKNPDLHPKIADFYRRVAEEKILPAGMCFTYGDLWLTPNGYRATVDWRDLVLMPIAGTRKDPDVKIGYGYRIRERFISSRPLSEKEREMLESDKAAAEAEGKASKRR